MAQRIGLLGGTFDPPHFGHLWLAETAREQLKLDEILFLPVGRPPHKHGNDVTAVSHRLSMIALAIAGNPHFHLDESDVNRAQPHTTYTLLPLIRQKFPGALIWLLVGADSLRDLPGWRHPQQVIAQCRLAALPRSGISVNWPMLNNIVPGIEQVVDLLDGPTLGISSTEVRSLVSAGRSIRYLVPDAVIGYINRQGLYRQGTAEMS